MKASVHIKELFINDGTRIPFDSTDIVVIVGANNSGKSTFLREIMNLSGSLAWVGNAKILKGLDLGSEGSVSDLIDLMKKLSFKETNHSGDIEYRGFQWSLFSSQARSDWDHLNTTGLSTLLGLFLKHVSSDGRLGVAAQVQSFNSLTDTPTHPIHFLYKFDEIATAFSEAFRKAFGRDLVINKGGGQFIHLHVGNRPKIETGEDRVSDSYLSKLQSLPTIQEQGDGMRSFVGLMLEVFLGTQSIVLIDEPEVFLHPPQARLLGRMIVRDVPAEKQIFISTHSEDFLKGLLDTNSDRVKVIRLDRKNDVNHTKELTKEQIKETWSDPLLRHSNVLSGLFHSMVVLCEGDMDCRFYSAILDTLIEIDQTKPVSEQEFQTIPDALFIHCGGKHRMPMVVRALVNLGVPIVVICDFDVLNESDPLKSIYEGLGGEWEEIRADWNIVKTQVDQLKPELETKVVKDQVSKLLEKETNGTFSPKTASEIKEVLRKTSAWSIAKSTGVSFIPSGDASRAYARLKSKLLSRRLVVVEVGEVERFDRSVGNHGPKWVNEVLLKNIKSSSDLAVARDFIKSIFLSN